MWTLIGFRLLGALGVAVLIAGGRARDVDRSEQGVRPEHVLFQKSCSEPVCLPDSLQHGELRSTSLLSKGALSRN